MELHVEPGMRLGKKNYKYDERTLKVGLLLDATVHFPSHYDFDQDRTKFPLPVWGNDAYGNCVKVAQAHQLLRVERIETRRTLKLTDNDVISEYKQQTGCQSPGDDKDTGLVMLDNMRDWRNVGWELPANGKTKKPYKIAAYGEIDPKDRGQIRAAIYLLHGVQLGFWLPLTARDGTAQGVWDVTDNAGREGQPGSWGGHAVFSKAYDEDSIEVLTWGQKVRVTNAFVEKYCDEIWVPVDDLDNTSRFLDVSAMLKHLKEIGATNVG